MRGPEEIAVGQASPANKSLDKMFLCGECDRPGAGPGLRDEMGNLWKSPGKMRETAKILRRQLGAHRVDNGLGNRRGRFRDLDESLVLVQFDDRPVPEIGWDLVVDGDERNGTLPALHHPDENAMGLGRAPIDYHNSALTFLCKRLDDTIDGEIAHLGLVRVEHEIGQRKSEPFVFFARPKGFEYETGLSDSGRPNYTDNPAGPRCAFSDRFT